MDARLGYKNKHDNHSDWTEIARSTEIRDLKCNLAKVSQYKLNTVNVLKIISYSATYIFKLIGIERYL